MVKQAEDETQELLKVLRAAGNQLEISHVQHDALPPHTTPCTACDVIKHVREAISKARGA